MLKYRGDRNSVCLIDFGLAAMLDSDVMSMRCGSPGFVAPEVLQDRRYGRKCDIFSLGIIFHTMIVGRHPFGGNDAKVVLSNNARGLIEFQHPAFSVYSESAKHLLAWMTQPNPILRCSAATALRHPWFHSKRLRLLSKDCAIVDNSPSILNRVPVELLSIAQYQHILGSFYSEDDDEIPTPRILPILYPLPKLAPPKRVLDYPPSESDRSEEEDSSKTVDTLSILEDSVARPFID